MNEITIKAHCENGPSTLPARAICPMYVSEGGGDAADSGTRAHSVVENLLKGDCDREIIDLTEDERNRGTWGAKKITELAEGAPVKSEERVESAMTSGVFAGNFGTCDAHWEKEDGRVLCVADFKTYANADDEKSYEPQLMAYALMIAKCNALAYKRVEGYVIAAGDRSVVRYDFKLEDAREEVIRILGNVKRATIANACPSAWCAHCGRRTTCPALGRVAEAAADGRIACAPLAVQKKLVPAVEAWVKGVNKAIKEALDRGERVYDPKSGIEYAYGERNANAVLTDLKGLAAAVIEYGVNAEDFARSVSISKTKVEELLKAVDETKAEKPTKKEREAVYLPYFTVPTEKVKVVKCIS